MILFLLGIPYWFTGPSPEGVEARGGRVRTVLADTFFSAWVPANFSALQNQMLQPVRRGRFQVDGQEVQTKDFPYGEGRAVLEQIRVVEAHKAGFTGGGVRVAVLDAGFDPTYPGIAHLFRNGQVKATYDFQSGDFLLVDTLTWPFFTGTRFYIQDFDITPDGYGVFTGATEDELNRVPEGGWRLYLFAFTGSAWMSPIELAPGTRDWFAPRILRRGDTLWVVANRPGERWFFRISLHDTLSVSELGPFFFPNLERRGDTLLLWGVDPAGRRAVERRRTSDLTRIALETYGVLPPGIRSACVGETTRVLSGDSLVIFAGSVQDTVLRGVEHLVCAGRAYAYVQNGILRVAGANRGPVGGRPVGLEGDTVAVATPVALLALTSGGVDTLLYGQVDKALRRGGRWWLRRRGDPDVTPEREITQHGSRMLSLIAGYAPGRWVGVAPGVEVVLARTERATEEFEHQVEEDFWVAGLFWAAAWGSRILSSSLGYGRASSGTWYSPADMDGITPVSSRVASAAARAFNLLVVTAMGNIPHSVLPPGGDTSLVAPADARDIVAVGGVDGNNRPVLNMGLGPTADGRNKPEVLAPYTATVPGPEGDLTISGTSVSTALTAGVAALVLEAHPELTALELRDRLLRTARPVEGYTVPNPITGWGIVQAWPALEGAPASSLPVLELEVPYPHPVPGDRPVRVVFPYRSDAPRLARLYIFRLDGRSVVRLTDLILQVGRGEIVWSSPGDLSRGVYWAVLVGPDVRARRMFLVR